MADNVTIGGGAVVGTDDVGGVQYQRVKISIGPDGSAVDATTTNPVPTVEAADGALLASAVTVTTTATLLPATALAGRKRIWVQNQGTVSVYLGGSAVTTSTGVELMPKAILPMTLGAGLLYGIATASCNVRVVEQA